MNNKLTIGLIALGCIITGITLNIFRMGREEKERKDIEEHAELIKSVITVMTPDFNIIEEEAK